MIEEYGPYIDYIKGEENIVPDVQLRLPLNINGETTHKPTYQK